jgi:transposase
MAGRSRNCLVERMGLEASPETLWRLIRQQEERQVPTPRVLGVDDFCYCRRRSYGAILIDLERRVPIDLLPFIRECVVNRKTTGGICATV